MNLRLISIIERYTDVRPVLPELKLKEDLGLDSMQLVRLAVEIEDTFGITVSDDAIERLFTVSDVEKLIH